MEIYIVFEYAEHTNKIVGCYKNEEDANRKHDESPTWRYVEKQKLKFQIIFWKDMMVQILILIIQIFLIGYQMNLDFVTLDLS